MENKKDLGKLFKAKLDGLEKSPNENLWEAINEELHENKKKKRIIPLYFCYTGAALLLLCIGFATKTHWITAFENIISSKNNSTIHHINSDTINTGKQNGLSNKPSNYNKRVENSPEAEIRIDSDNGQNAADNFQVETDNTAEGLNQSRINADKIVNSSSKGNSQSTSNRNTESKPINKSENSSTRTPEKFNKNKSTSSVGTKTNKSAKSHNLSGSNNSSNSNANINVNRVGNLINQAKFNNQEITEKALDSIKRPTATAYNKTTNTLEFDDETIAHLENIKNEFLEETYSLTVDSRAVKRNSKLVLHLAAQNILDSVETAKQKYYVFAHADVSAFNHFGNQSLIDSQLDNYDTTTELMYNYGIYFGFIANSKLSIRIGVNNTSLSLHTKNVPLTSENSNSATGYFSNVDYVKPLNNEQLAAYLGASNATLNQNFRFVEIPLEAKYRIYDGTIGIETIGGISSLFLSKNEVKVEANDQFLNLGKVNNVWRASASLNLGVGFSYKVGKNLQLNVEPMFKYYLRAFEINNKPYSLNVQAGVQ